MRVIATLSTAPLEWFSGNPKQAISEAISNDGTPFDKFLVLTNSAFATEFQASIAQLRSEGQDDLAAKIADVYRDLIWKATDNKLLPGDIHISTNGMTAVPITKLRNSETFKTILETRSRKAARDSGRASFYDRCLKPLVLLADRIEIIDPYAAESIMKNRDWLFGQLLRDAIGYVALTTNIQKDGDNRLSSDFNLYDAFAKKLESRFDETQFSGKSLNVKILRVDPNFHDRFLVFKFRSGSFGIALPRGIDNFASPKLPVGFVPKEHTRAELDDYLWVLGKISKLFPDINLRSSER